MIQTRQYRPLFEYAAATYTFQLGKSQHLFSPWYAGPGRAAFADEWLEAVALHESLGNPKARRYEKHQDKKGRADAATDADRPGVDDGTLEDDASYGLMQVMGYNWRKILGSRAANEFTVLPVELRFDVLLDPLVSIYAGCVVLSWELAATGGDVARALARYNGGPSGEKMVAGRMRTQAYVDKVRAALDQVRSDRAR